MSFLPSTSAEDVIGQPARTQFEAFLDEHRSDLNHCLDGLTEEQARRSLVPSRTTLLGLVKHAASSGRSGSTKPSPTGRAEIGTETADLCTVMRLDIRIEART